MLFRDRDEAGELLADVLMNLRGSHPVVVGIAPGGVRVARHVADRLGAPLTAVTKTATDAPPEASGRTVLLVDDGICTGATMLAALRLVATARPARLIAAAPVAPPRLVFGRECADLYVVARPAPFTRVSRWYAAFPEVGDAEVQAALTRDPADQAWAAYAGATSL